MAWEEDYKNARIIESEIEERLKALTFKTENSAAKKNFPDWDISVTSATTSKVYTLEVKYQGHPRDIYIEAGRYVDNHLQPTGILSTKSTHHCFSFLNDPVFYLIKTAKLRQLIKDRKNMVQRIDKGNYLLKIFPREHILQYSNKF